MKALKVELDLRATSIVTLGVVWATSVISIAPDFEPRAGEGGDRNGDVFQ